MKDRWFAFSLLFLSGQNITAVEYFIIDAFWTFLSLKGLLIIWDGIQIYSHGGICITLELEN